MPDAKQKRDFSCYDTMSTEELERFLRLDFQASDGETDMEAILYISGLLARRGEPADSAAAWERFQTRYRPCADGRSLYEFAHEPDGAAPRAGHGHGRRLLWLGRLAAAMLACLMVTTVVAQAAGVDVLGSIVRWTDGQFSFGSRETGDESEWLYENITLYTTPQEARLEELFPAWGPEGYTPDELMIEGVGPLLNASLYFQGEGENYYIVSIDWFDSPEHNGVIFEKDDGAVEQYLHNDQVFYLFTNGDYRNAAAFDGVRMTRINGTLTREQVIALIDSIEGSRTAPDWQQMRAYLESGEPAW